MDIFKIIEWISGFAASFTKLYVWLAACVFLALEVNNISANACFYGGVIYAITACLTGDTAKKKLWRKGL